MILTISHTYVLRMETCAVMHNKREQHDTTRQQLIAELTE